MRLFDPRSPRLMTFLALASVMVLSTCSVNQVGLGAKVDITPPKVKISSPLSSGLYLKGTINLAGTVSDDIKVSSVTVSYSKAGGGSANISASVSDSSWTLTVPSNTADGIAEGKQTITVTASDASGKASSDYILVYVDNQTPTVLVTYPLSHGSTAALKPQSTDTIDIKGEVSDDSPIVDVVVTVIDGAGNPVASRSPSLNPNPRTADGTNTWSARFYLKDTSKGLQVTDGQDYYYKVIARDEAGNQNVWYYHINDIPGLMPDLDTATPERETGPLPTISELGVLDHSPAGTLSSPTQLLFEDLVMKRLALDVPAPTYGNFQYMAVSAPTIRFSNLDQTKPQNQNLLSPGGVVTGTIAPPLNSGTVDSSSMTVKLYSGATIPGTLLATYGSGDTANLQLTNLGDSLGFTIPLKNGATALTPGPFSLVITAKAQTSSARSETVAFFLDSGAPTLTANSLPTFSKTLVELKGDASSSLDLDRIEITEKKDGAVKDKIPDLLLSGTSANWTTGVILPQNKTSGVTDADLSGTYEYAIDLVSVSGKRTSLFRSFTYDATPPEMTADASPLVGTNTVNGTIKVSGLATDLNGLTGVRWSLRLKNLGEPAWTNADSTLIASPPYSATVNTTTLTDESDYTLWFRSEDKAGNAKTDFEDLRVSQASDKPVIQLTNLDASVTGTALAVAKANLLQNGAKILANVTDDDGIAASTIEAQTDGGAWSAVTKKGSDGMSTTFEEDVSGLADGVHTVAFRAADKNGTLTTLPAVAFVLDTAVPSLTVSGGAGWYQNSITLTGTATDANGLSATVPVKLTKDGGSPLTVTVTPDGAGAWTTGSLDITALGDGSHTWSLVATDAVGKTTSQAVSFQIDRTPPSFSLSNLAGGELFSSSTVTIVGTASDSGSGVAKVQYRLNGGAWTDGTGTSNWTVNISSLSDNLADTLELQALDNSGNTTATVTRTFKVDLAAPTFTETASAIVNSSVVYKSASVSFGGNASDGNDLASVAVTYSKNGAAAVDLLRTTNPNNGPWTATLNQALGDGSYELNFAATDKVGKTTSFVRNVVIDTSAPELTVTAPLDYPTISPTPELVATSSYTLRGQVTDNGGSGVASLAYSRNGTTWTGALGGTIPLTGLNWTKAGVDFSTPVGSEATQGQRTVYIRATDNSAHTVTKTITFNYDTQDPVLTETGSLLTSTLVNRNTAVVFSGASSDTNSLDTVKFSLNGGTAFEVTDTNTDGNASTRFDTWSYTLPVSTQGTFAITFTATDVAGRTTSITRNVLIDTSAPTTPVFTTSPGSYVTTSLAVAGTTGDASGSGVQTVSYRIDGNTGDPATGTLTGTDDWFATLNVSALGLGTHKVSTWATDRAGNKSSEQFQNFVVDRADPTIASAAPATLGTNANLSLTGTAGDDVSLASVSASYSKDGNPSVNVTPGGTPAAWSVSVPVSNGSGSYVYTVTATDSVGRTKSLTRTVVIDTQAPTTAISNINSDGSTLVNSSTYTVTGTAADVGLSGLATVEYSTDGTTWSATTGTGSWIVPLSGLTDGLAQKFWLRAADNATNQAAELQYTFKVDLAAPTFTETISTIPSASVVYKNATVSFGGAALDGNGLASVTATYSKNGGAAVNLSPASGAGTWTASLNSALGDGAYEVTFTATDNVGKTTSFVRNVVIDTTPPTLPVTSPAANELVASASFVMSGQVTDDGGKGVTALEFSRDNSTWTGSGLATATGGSITLAGLGWSKTLDFSTPVGGEAAEGARTVYLRATDGLNPYTTQTINFFYDTVPPVLTETTSGFDATLKNRNSAVTFGGAASDTNALKTWDHDTNGGTAEVPYVEVSTDGGTTKQKVTVSAGVWTYTLAASEGTYPIVITATDVAGRKTEINRLVLIDVTPPTAPVFTSATASYVTNSLPVAGTATDGSGSGVQTASYRIDSLPNAALTGTNDWFSTIDVSGLGEGSHSLAVWTVDRAGNLSSETVLTFYVDRNDPALDSPAAASQNTKVDVTLSGTSSDANGLTSVTAGYVKNGAGGSVAATVVGTTSWSISVPTSLGDGSYVYTIQSTDTRGRVSSISRTVVIDTTAPTVSVSNPANLAVVSDANLSVSGSASDALSGVTLVEYRLTPGAWTALTGTTNWNGTVALGGEGTKTLEFRSTDALGTTSSVSTRTINLDLTPPSLDETGVGASSPKRSADFALSGTASDTNGLKTWDHDSNIGTAEVPYVEVSSDGGTTKTKVTVSVGAWSYNFTVNPDGSTDGDKNFIVYATDSVGKTTTLSRTVTVDATPPVITIDGVIAGLNVTTNAVNGTITFRFSANDTGVGLERAASTYQAYYTLVANNAGAPAPMTGWTSVTSASSVFSFTVDTSAYGLAGNEDLDLWVGLRDGVTGGANVPNAAMTKTDLTVNQDSNRPVLTTDNMDKNAASASLNGFGQNPTILLTIEDDDSVDVSQLEYRIDANNDGDYNDVVDLGANLAFDKWETETVWNTVEEVPTTDRSLAQAKIKLTQFPQGAFRIQVRARDTTDAALWSTIYGVTTNFTWVESPSIRFAVDYGPPTIAVTAPSAGTYNADFALTGTAADALGVISVDYTLNGGSSYTNVFTNAGGATSAPFSAVVDADVLATGEYILQVEATDFGGTTATQQIPITIDRTGPTVTVLQPGEHGTLNGPSVTVRGEASDNRQLGAVFLWHGKVSDPDPVTLPSRTGPGTYSPGSYTAVTGSSIWSTTIDTTATTLTGADGYRIRTVAVDSIGNVGTPTDYLVTVDQNSDRPTIAFSNLATPGPSRLALGNLSIIGTANDDDSVKANSLQIRIDRNGDTDFGDANEGWVAVSQLPASNSLVVSWVHEITDLFSEGLHHVQVRALDTTDVAADYTTGFGWNNSAVVPFFIDNGPPALEVTTPTLGQRFNVNSFTLTGTTQDTNGIDHIVIWVDNDEDTIQDAGELTTIGSSLTTDNTLYNINQAITGLSDGTKTVRVNSYDSSNALTVRELTVVIDTTAPTATISTPSGSSTVNGTISVIGTATDNYQVSKVYWNLSLTASGAPAFVVGAGAGQYHELVGQTYAWNTTLNTTGYGNGAYTLRVVVLDAAGNNSSASPASVAFTIDQTTDKPIIDVLTVEETGTAVANLLPPSLAVSGTVQDDDSVDRTKIQVRSKTLPAGAWSGWTNVTGQPASNSSLAIWSHTFTGFTDGQYEFEIRAADVNDAAYDPNSSATSATVPFSVDLSLPTGSVTAPTQASFHNTDVTISGASADASGIKKVSIAFDSGGGYGAETVLYNDTNSADGYATPYNWSTAYAVSNGDAQVFFRVTITDAFDKVRTLEQYFTVDTLGPTTTFLLPTAGSTLNGSVLVRGTANDGNQVASVYFKVNNLAGPGTWASGDPASNGWTLLSGKYNWEQRFNSSSVSDGAARVYILALDAAGNRSNPTSAANQLDFTVNQAANKPVVTISTPNNALLDNSGTIQGTITDDDSVNSSTVQINLGDGAGWVSVTTASATGPTVSFTHSVAGLAQRSAAYTVQVRASDTGEDFTGTADDIPAAASDVAFISIKKDDGDPTIGITNLNNGLLTVTTLQGVYLKDKLTLTGTAADGVQVSTVQARLPGITGAGAFTDVAVSDTGTNFSTWSWTLSGLTLPGTTVNLEVKVTDVNGRSSTTAYTLLVDTVAPAVTIDTPALNPDTSSGAYNGSFSFRGSASDLVKVEKVYYQWGTSAASQPSGTYGAWTLAGSTYSWTTASLDSTALYSDAVNHTYHLSVVSVDSAGNESPVQDLSFTINQASDRPVIVLSQPTLAQVLETNAKTTGTATDDDGLASIEYRVDLNNDGDFADASEGYVAVTTPATASGKSQSFENTLASLADGYYKLQIRVQDNGYAAASVGLKTYHETETTVTDYSIDKAAPALSLSTISVQHRYGGATTVISSGFNGSYVNNDFTLRFGATDSSGIAAVETSLDNVTYTPAGFVSGSSYDAAIPIVALTDGTRSVYYRATDNNGKTTSGLLTLIVDKTIPVVSFQSPSGIFKDDSVSNAPNVNGTAVTVSGSVTDGSSIASLTIVGGVSDNVPLTNTGNNTSWSVTFNASTYATATYAVETGSGTNVWRMPIKITAYDAAGMRTINTGYVDLDPDGDKPIVIISTPAANASVTGIITLNGTVTDDDGTSGTVDIGLDTDNNGTYTDQVFTNVSVSNGAWTQQINTSGTLSGTVNFQVTPKDVNGKLGDVQQRTIFIDSSLPSIVGYNGSTVLPAPTPNTGTKQKGTITVRALFRDDDVIPPGNLQVSLDGGTTYAALSTQPGYTINQLADLGGKKRYDVSFNVNTATYFADNSGNGTASVILQITDNTYKPAVVSLSYAVDNRPPEVTWNSALVPQSGVYSFSGSTNGDNNKLVGKAVDGGSVSGVSSVSLYFVKGGAFRDPKLVSGSTPQTLATAGDGLYTLLAFTAGAVNTATDVMTLDRTAANLESLGGTVNNTLPVRFVGASLPGGLDANVLYYVRDVSGATFKLSLSPTDATRIDLTGTGTGSMEYALSGIPYTTDVYTDSTASGRYGILIDKRTELGSNDGNANGDGDGFQESLKDGGGYDDWFVYLDTTKLPDGPFDLYQVVTDNSGNKVVSKTLGQITNNPPSIDSLTVNGTALGATPWKAKTGTSGGTAFDVVLNANDIGAGPNIALAGWKLEVLSRWGNGSDVAGSAETTYTNWFYGGSSGTPDAGAVRGFTSRGSGSGLPVSATVALYTNGGGAGQESSFANTYWYLLKGTTMDTDGNLATREFYIKINNSDASAPTVTFPDLEQTNLSDWTAKTPLSLDLAAASLTAASPNFAAALPSWITANTKVMFAGGNAPGGFTPGTVYYIVANTNPFQLAAAPSGAGITVTSIAAGTTYTLVSGGHLEAKAESTFDQATSDADVSGSIRLTGTASDDTDVRFVGVQLNGAGASVTLAGSTFTANGHGLSNGTPVFFTATGWPTTLLNGTTLYYVVSATANTFAVATSVNGSAITPAGAATGLQFWTPANLVQTSGNVISGYNYNWSFVWDTSRIATVAAANVLVKAIAVDLIGNSTPANLGTAGTVDVVPYITSITDPTGLAASVLRGATGAYSITKSNNKLNVYGFNLGRPAALPTAWNGLAASSYVTGGTTASITTASTPSVTPDATYPSNLVAVPKNWTRSGYFTVTVNGVPSGNNLNNDANSNNSEVNAANPTTAKWNDNRVFWVWATTQVNPTSLTTTSANATLMTYYNPDMIVNTANADQVEFAFNDDNGGILAYTTSDTAAVRKSGFRKMAQAAYTTATVSGTLQRFFATGFDSMVNSVDNTGLLEVMGWNTALQTADNWNQNYGPSVFSDQGVQWMAVQGNDYYSDNAGAWAITYRYLNRFPHPKLIVTPSVVNAGGANAYLGYYDASPNAQSLNFVSFYYAPTLAGGTATAGNLVKPTAGNQRSSDVVMIPGTSSGRSSSYFGMAKVGNSGMAVAYFDPSTGTLKLATSANAYQFTGTAGTGGTDNKTNTANNVRELTSFTIANGTVANYNGKYFRIFNETTPYDVFYDSSAGQTGTNPGPDANSIKVNINGMTTAAQISQATATAIKANAAFRDSATPAANATNTFRSHDFGTTTDATTGTVLANMTITVTTQGATNWSTITIDNTGTVGQHVSLVADGTNLYMAYQDGDNGQLKFARVPWDGTGTPSAGAVRTAKVDGQPSVPISLGSWTNIMLLNLNSLTGVNKAEPVVAYYTDSYNGTKSPIRFAVPKFDAANNAVTLQDGVNSDDTYTGNWEIMTVQAISNPAGGDDRFNKVQLAPYAAASLPVVGWVGTKPEYAKLQPNN